MVYLRLINKPKNLQINQKYKKHNASSVWSLIEDSNYNIWIGTDGSGIILYNNQTQNSKQILSSEFHQGIVLKMLEDNDFIWATTYNYGLLKINKQNFSVENISTKIIYRVTSLKIFLKTLLIIHIGYQAKTVG